MSELLKKYRDLRGYLADGLDTCKVSPEQEEAILDELDTLWYAMTDEEHEQLDTEGEGDDVESV